MDTELINTVFFSLEDQYKGNINKIIEELYKFLKDNDLSNNLIREHLQEFFLLKREYIFLEYGKSYAQIGHIVEGLMYQNEMNLQTNNASEVPNTINQSITQIMNEEEKEDDDDELDENDQEFNNLLRNINPSNLRVNNVRNNLVFTYYDSFFPSQVYFPNNQMTLNQPYIMINPQVQVNNNELPNIMLNTNVENPNNRILNLFQSLLTNPNMSNIDFENNLEEQINMNSINDVNNALNFFSIILNNPTMNMPNMTDVKNVINQEELDKLEVKEYSNVDKQKYKECMICLDDYKDEDKIRILKCEHGFHKDCVDKWLKDCNYKCPICRDDSNKHHAEI